MAERRFYKVVFHDQGRTCEIYAREVSQGGLFGFIEISGLVFGAKTEVVIDPSEERLRQEFQDVKRIHVPLHSVVRIDEVEKEGTGRILEAGDAGRNVKPFPVPVYTPKGGDS